MPRTDVPNLLVVGRGVGEAPPVFVSWTQMLWHKLSATKWCFSSTVRTSKVLLHYPEQLLFEGSPVDRPEYPDVYHCQPTLVTPLPSGCSGPRVVLEISFFGSAPQPKHTT